MVSRFVDHMLEGATHAELPDPATVPVGSLFSCLEHALIYKNADGVTWETWAALSPPDAVLNEKIRDAMGTALVSGSPNVTIGPDDPGDTITITVAEAAPGIFRGVWSPDALAETLDLSTVPPEFDLSHDTALTYSLDPYSVSGGPGGYLLRHRSGNQKNTSYSQSLLNLSELGITGITRITFQTQATGLVSQSFHVKKNGADVASGGNHAWIEREILCAETDTVTFRVQGDSGGATTHSDNFDVSAIKVYATAEPYQTGEYVVYQGSLWVSDTDSNGGVPGVAGWTEVPLGDDPGPETFLLGPGDHASRPAPATVVDGTLYSCTDHGLVYQSDGAAWAEWAQTKKPRVVLLEVGGAAVDVPAGTPVGSIIFTKGA